MAGWKAFSANSHILEPIVEKRLLFRRSVITQEGRLGGLNGEGGEEVARRGGSKSLTVPEPPHDSLPFFFLSTFSFPLSSPIIAIPRLYGSSAFEVI